MRKLSLSLHQAYSLASAAVLEQDDVLKAQNERMCWFCETKTLAGQRANRPVKDPTCSSTPAKDRILQAHWYENCVVCGTVGSKNVAANTSTNQMQISADGLIFQCEDEPARHTNLVRSGRAGALCRILWYILEISHLISFGDGIKMSGWKIAPKQAKATRVPVRLWRDPPPTNLPPPHHALSILHVSSCSPPTPSAHLPVGLPRPPRPAASPRRVPVLPVPVPRRSPPSRPPPTSPPVPWLFPWRAFPRPDRR